MRNIEKEMQKFNVSIYDIKELLDCTEKTVRNKLNGTTDFTFSEVKKIRDKKTALQRRAGWVYGIVY